LVYTAFIQVSVKYGELFSKSCNQASHSSSPTGIGAHLKNIDLTQLPLAIKYMYIGELFLIIAVPLGKTSFCITLLRLTQTSWHKWTIWFVLVTHNVTMWAAGIIMFVQCSPVEKLWNIALPGTCWDNRIAIYYSVAVGGMSLYSATEFTVILD
jgi:hypothetical protein